MGSNPASTESCLPQSLCIVICKPRTENLYCSQGYWEKSEGLEGRKLPGCQVYEFPTVAVTNDHKLSGLNQHTFIILQFWQSDIRNGSHLAESTILAGLRASPSLRGGGSLEATCIPRLLGSSSGGSRLSPHATVSLALFQPLSQFQGPLG